MKRTFLQGEEGRIGYDPKEQDEPRPIESNFDQSESGVPAVSDQEMI